MVAAAEIESTAEENAWEDAAAASDDGPIILRSVDLRSQTDMQEVYEVLHVRGPCPKSRLRAYIERLQAIRRKLNEEEVQRLTEENHALRNEREAFRMAELRARSSTERALAASDDVLYDLFERAPITPLWLQPLESTQHEAWDTCWSDYYALTESSRTETSDTIQPKLNSDFIPKLPTASPYDIVDTHSDWNKLTQDATLFLRGRPRVELTIAAIIEWVVRMERVFHQRNTRPNS
uniref:Uncharacterized protein n=1 Tax=Grammatophora oceanica TaxID=210454 RepID=A0A7S1VDT7_9STRA|mmetsp:Transcript_43982/g.65231  ORF Transcript_43982/g.65231 Transcript_43982/m.65231 type:complete len:236 (+) Transcript_43982:115-822(+)